MRAICVSIAERPLCEAVCSHAAPIAQLPVIAHGKAVCISIGKEDLTLKTMLVGLGAENLSRPVAFIFNDTHHRNMDVPASKNTERCIELRHTAVHRY